MNMNPYIQTNDVLQSVSTFNQAFKFPTKKETFVKNS